MMKIVILTFMMLCGGCVANADIKHDIDSLIIVLDKEVERSEEYVERHEQEMTALKNSLGNTRTDMERYELNRHLFYVYRAFQNDSAMHYLSECRRYAQRLGRKDLEGEMLSRWAGQLAAVGKYYESREIIDRVDVDALSKEGKAEYYNAYIHLCHELAYYSSIPQLKDECKAKEYRMLDSLTALVGKHNEMYYRWQGFYYYSKHKDQDALKLYTEWVRSTKPETHEYAIAAFFMFLINERLGNQDEMKYWLIMSSIADIRQAVMDQGSLWTLAEILADEGDVERAHNYINYSWNVAQRFNTKVRSGQISPILTTIDEALQDNIREHNRWLLVTVIVVSLLLVMFFVLLMYNFRQHRKLGRSRDELHDTNKQLQSVNDQVKAINEELSLSNAMLNESNRVKEEYIGRFLNLCSFYIGKIEDLRKQINKMVKAKQYDEIYRMTHSSDMKKMDLEDLYSNFDKAFTHLFPNFLDEFNALLQPEERVTTESSTKLNTTVRIFALIRLGVDDSAKIAEFLNYSVHTIYNYRVKMRNAAIGNRDEFEQKVKMLGLPPR